MTFEWKECALGEQITLQRGYDITRKEMKNGTVPVISSGGISGYHNTPIASGPGVIIGRKGSLGTVHYVSHEYWPHDTTLWVKDFHGNNPRFVYYFLKFLDLKRLDVGSANPTLNRNIVHPIRVKWTNIENQEFIVNILETLDEKIELNNSIIETIQQMLFSVYKEWFVHFARFKEIDSNSKLPNGWKQGVLGDLVSERKVRVGDSTDLEVLSVVNTGKFVRSDELFEKQVYSKDLSKYKLVEKWDYAYNPYRINIGSIAMLEKEMTGAVSPAYVVFRPKKGYEWFLRFFILLDYTKDQMSQLSSGSVRQSLRYSDLTSIKVNIPSEDVVESFNKIVRQYHNMILSLEDEINELEEVRDYLLPRLLTGRIKMKVPK
jgi:type I restriction enzyme, S subunit